MDWKIEQKESFCVIAISHSFNEENAGTGIPIFLSEYKNAGYTIPAQLGLCETPEFGYDWVYSIGSISLIDDIVPDGFRKITVPATQWAVFSGASESQMRTYIYTEWFLNSGYEILPGYTVELYDANSIKEIWIPVRKNS